ncbi:OmpA family protein [Flavobacterium sp. CS20]|uniref:OmpA family protein n=1 Tax=Flavobacterium sp. CS20 TaxID=2775246 RepID=UPI001B3A015B|nr:OmpA family protein [Flavobacterium sp. CS20]QTY28201.1 OmpA family protein [Flavobacterium sp. CS20]
MKYTTYITSVLLVLVLVLACKSDKRTTKEEGVEIEERMEGFQNTPKDMGGKETENFLEMEEIQEFLNNSQISEDQMIELQKQLEKISNASGNGQISKEDLGKLLEQSRGMNVDTKALKEQVNNSPNIPDKWKEPYHTAYNTKIADVVYRYGDIDNFGFGWPEGFDPFSGESTPRHKFPFYPKPSDPTGTDRIMVVSAYKYRGEEGYKKVRRDGYTSSTKRPDNQPKKMVLAYNLKGTSVKTALLQLFIDDFQAPNLGSKFKFWLNGKEAVYVNNLLNEVEQTGPIGKLLSVQIIPEFIPDVESSKLEIFIDGSDEIAGDGFAIDFIRLLVNPKNIPTSSVEGLVLDAKTNEPIEGAMVKVSGSDELTTQTGGSFKAEYVPSGLVVIQANKAGYKNNKATEDLIEGETAKVTIKLEPETKENLEKQLEEKGKIELYGIYFDTDKAILKPESETTLRQVLALINSNPEQKLEIGGHTDSQGDEAYNLQLSDKRAQAVLQWLKDHNTNTANLSSKGYGETEPVADNNSETGRALNRRVEIKLLK